MSKERTEDWNLEGIVYIINIVTVFFYLVYPEMCMFQGLK